MDLLVIGMIYSKLIAKVTYIIGSLFVFMSLFIPTTAYADKQSDIAELEAFYHQVFNTKAATKKTINRSNVKSKSKSKNKRKTKSKTKAKSNKTKAKLKPRVKPRKVKKEVRTSNKKIKVKDPELVAFYESVFGKLTDTDSVDSTSTSKVVANKTSKGLKTKKQSKSPTISEIRNLNVNKPDSKSIKNSKTSQNVIKQTPTTSDKQKHSKTKQIKNNDSASIKKVVSDNKPLSTETKKIDTADLFKQAFGTKKNNKTASSSNANPGDLNSLFAKAFGGKAAANAVPSKVKVDLRINNVIIGETEIFSNSSGSFDQIDALQFEKFLKEALKEHVFLRIKEQLDKNKKTKFNSLTELGISAIYNSTNLSLDVEIKPELRKPLVLSLRSKNKASVREENIIEAEKISGFLNAFTNVGLNSNGGEADLRVRLEGSLNLNGFVLESTSDFRNDDFDLGRTTLTYDKPEKLQRLTLGNISTGSRNFQENLELDGFRISKEFFLDPDLQISPKANEALELDSDSEVELYINNQLIRRIYLTAGVYALEDIGLFNGANDIRIRIKDEFGNVTVKTSEQYYDALLLKPGLSLFSISVGYLSGQQSFNNSDLENAPIFSGYYQKGINENLTLSLDAQLSSESYLLGAETISSIPLGSLLNSIAVSNGTDRKTGYATSFEFRPNKKQERISLDTLRQDLIGLDTRSRGFLNNWSITGEYRSEEFSMLDSIDSDLLGALQSENDITVGNDLSNTNQLRGNLQTNLNLNISDTWQGNLNLGVIDYYDADASYFVNFSATKRFDNGTRLSIGSSYDTEDEFSLGLQISIPLSRKKGKRRVNLDVLTDSRDNSYETKLSVKPTALVGANSFAGSLEYSSDDDSKQQVLDLQYRSNLFESQFTARNRSSNGSGSSSQQFNLGFNTAIACVGGSCAASNPIDDSFALVSGPSNQTQPIALSNNNIRFRYSEGNDTGLPDNYSALISGKGKKAVVKLESYRSQNINIDEGTLPNGYDTEKTEFAVFPNYQQGFLIKAGGEPASTIDGMLLDELNKVLPFKGGQWVPEDEGKTVAFFSNKGGRFRVTSIPVGKYRLELFDFPEMEPIHISVPDTKGKPHDIGNLIIKTPN